MIKSYSYLRVSGLSQIGEDKDGFPRQHDAIARFADKNGYQVTREFQEPGVSGKKGEVDRPAFMDMVSCIMKGGTVRHVLIESLQRLAREYRVQENLLLCLSSKGIQLIACDTGENITEAMAGDPMRKALVQIQGIFNELDRALLIQKLNRGRKRRRDQGLRAEGRHPYGTHPKHPEEAPFVPIIKSMRQDAKTFQQIADHLNAIGAPTRMPNSRWFPSQVSRVVERV